MGSLLEAVFLTAFVVVFFAAFFAAFLAVVFSAAFLALFFAVFLAVVLAGASGVTGLGDRGVSGSWSCVDESLMMKLGNGEVLVRGKTGTGRGGPIF